MGRIEKALSRARAQRESGGPPAQIEDIDTPTAAPVPRPAPHRSVPERRLQKTPENLASLWDSFDSFELNLDKLESNRVIEGLLQPAVTSSYKMLRTRLKQRLRANGNRTLAITSAGSGDGKTLTSVNLAVSLARDVEQYVVLVDFDLKRPSVSRTLGLDSEACRLSNCIADPSNLKNCIVRSQFDRLAFLLNDEVHTDSSEVLVSPNTMELCRQLKSFKDCIILFDMPPVLATDDLLAFSPLVESVLLVVTEGKTSREDLGRVHDLLEGSNLIGTILNRSADKAPTYY